TVAGEPPARPYGLNPIPRPRSDLSLVPSIVLLLYCSIVLFWLGPLQAQKGFRDSLVRIHLDHEFPGVVYESRYIPHIRVREVTQLQGCVIDSRGYIVCYVGSYWPELSLPGIGVHISVETSDGKKHPARLIGVDERVALVVLESLSGRGHALTLAPALRETGIRFVSFSGANWQIVSPTMVKLSGNDLLPERELQIVSTAKKVDRWVLEGGLVLDGQDRLVGIVTHARSHPFSKKIQVWQVLPSEVVRGSVTRILEEKRNIKAGWLGIMLDPGAGQLRVEKVIRGSPAQEAGLRSEDVIVRVDGQSVQTRSNLAQAIRWKGAGARLNLSVLRRGRVEKVSAVLTERQDKEPVVSWRLEIPRPWKENEKPEEQVKLYRTILPSHLDLGFVVEPVTPQLARFFRCPKDQGLLIKSVLLNSPAQKVGFQAGDVLTQINGWEVSSHADIQESLKEADDGAVVIQFVRGGRLLTRKLILQ
ncbi:MAG: PDZ domain-containing protein, partial [Acidobacteriota bacterium]